MNDSFQVMIRIASRYTTSLIHSMLLVFLWCILFIIPSYAAVINVVTEKYPPYQYIDKQGEVKGCAVDLVHALFKITGDDLNIQVLPWARAYNTAKKFENTLIFSIVRNKLREKEFQWIGKVKTEHYFFWGLKSTYPQDRISDDEFSSSVIVVSTQTTNDEMLTAQGQHKLYRVTDLTQGIQMLLTKRVDLIVETKVGLQERFKRMGLDISKIKPVYDIPELNNILYLAFNINTKSTLVKRYRVAYQQLVKSGTFNSIINQCGK